MAASGGRWRDASIAALLYALALVPRSIGLDFLLPHSPEPDAVYALQPEFLAGPTSNPEYASYPLLVGWLVTRMPPSAELAPDAPLEDRLAQAAEPLRRVRWVVAVASALIAPATYLVARSFLGAGWSAVAALFAATSLMHLNFSQQGRPHAPLAAALALAVALAVRARRSGGLRAWLGASAASALPLAFLQSGVFALPALAVAFALRERARRADWTRWLATLAILGATVWLGYPFLRPEAIARWSRVVDGKLQFGGHNLVYDKFDGRGMVVMLQGLWGYDPALLAAAALGVVAAWLALRRARLEPEARGARRDAAVVAAALGSYALVFGLYRGSLDRFALPLVPALALLAAAGVRWLASLVSRRAVVHVALALGVLALPSWAAARLARLRSLPDTLELACERIERQLPPGARLAMQPWFELPLASAPEALAADTARWDVPMRYFWARYQLAHPAPGGRTVRLLPPARDPFWGAPATELAPALERLDAGYLVCVRAAEDPLAERSAVVLEFVRARLAPAIGVHAMRTNPRGYTSLQYESSRFLLDVLNARLVGPEVSVFEVPARPKRR